MNFSKRYVEELEAENTRLRKTLKEIAALHYAGDMIIAAHNALKETND